MKEQLAIAMEPDVVRRAVWYAVIVGAILIVINHWDAILSGNIGRTRLVKMALTVVVPYFVSTMSSVGTLHQVRSADRPGRSPQR